MICDLKQKECLLAKYFKPFKKITIMALLVVFLAGCWDSVDINERLIATSNVLDVKDNEIWLHYEFVNIKPGKTKETGESTHNKYMVYNVNGKTLAEIRDSLDSHLDEQPYLSGVSVLLFTEDFANEHIVEYLYRFRSDETYRKKVISATIRGEPEELYDIAHKKNISLGLHVEGILKTLEDINKSFHARITMRLLENISSTYTGILLPCIGIKNGELALAGYSVFNDTGIAGFIPAEESRAEIYLKADKPSFEYIVPYNGINFTLETRLKKRKIMPYHENGKTRFDIRVNCEAKLKYGDKRTPYGFKKTDAEKVAETLGRILKKQISEAISRAQTEFKCDYFQFDDEFRIKYPTEFEDMDWKKEFTRAGINVDVKIDMLTLWPTDYSISEVR